MRAMQVDSVMSDIERQVREIRAAGHEPAAVELGDGPYQQLVQAHGDQIPALTLVAGGDQQVWFPGTLPSQYSPKVTDLPIRRIGPGTRVQVVTA